MPKRIVVTGMGAITPAGQNVDEMWQAVCEGRSAIGPITAFDASALETRIAAEVKGFDPAARFGARNARRLDRFMQFALVAAEQAVADAKLDLNQVDKDRIAVVIGSGIGGIGSVVEQVEVMREKGPRRVSPFLVPMMLADSAAGQVAIQLGARGPNLAVLSACASGVNAIGEAMEIIRRGAADVAVCGGAEAGILPLSIAAFNVMGAVSTDNDDPLHACRPFDATRGGFVMGEGSGILILESEEHARARGARVYGEVAGYGSSADAFHIAAPVEDGSGAALSMRRALESGGIAPEDIDYINAHGTGTPLNDAMETRAVKTVFGARAYQVPISSTKPVTGHLLGAAGAIEAIICLKAIESGCIPPTINLTTPDPACDLDYVPNQARRAKLRAVMTNSFGFGGHNATLILRAPQAGLDG